MSQFVGFIYSIAMLVLENTEKKFGPTRTLSDRNKRNKLAITRVVGWKNPWPENQIGETKDRAKKSGENIEELLHYQGILYILAIIWTKLISLLYDDSLAGHFRIEKTRELIAQNYHWKTPKYRLEIYLKGCDLFLDLKVMRQKLYRDLQSLLIVTDCGKNIFIDFVIGLYLFSA